MRTHCWLAQPARTPATTAHAAHAGRARTLPTAMRGAPESPLSAARRGKAASLGGARSDSGRWGLLHRPRRHQVRRAPRDSEPPRNKFAPPRGAEGPPAAGANSDTCNDKALGGARPTLTRPRSAPSGLLRTSCVARFPPCRRRRESVRSRKLLQHCALPAGRDRWQVRVLLGCGGSRSIPECWVVQGTGWDSDLFGRSAACRRIAGCSHCG